jgi:hypothetical protein
MVAIPVVHTRKKTPCRTTGTGQVLFLDSYAGVAPGGGGEER